MSNRVECIAGRWVVIGRGGCPECQADYEISLVIPKEFVAKMILEGQRRQREINRAFPAASLEAKE